ncbi:hypothetical protein TWF696_007074 [Orbilia brochopaga]|uniref:Opioid growth factor receptor (OGFr) conserved domain-containing protein n=1 Tax=Orbilia brochopaga TaxID=3140254 RepID=A0AAV9UR71_9PEZI
MQRDSHIPTERPFLSPNMEAELPPTADSNRISEGERQQEREGSEEPKGGQQSELAKPTEPLPLPPIISFYQGGRDFRGRTLDEILNWPDSKLEYNHDYIQLLFPLPERSNFMLHPASRLDDAAMDLFKKDHRLRAGMRTALARMLRFFGFDCDIVNLKDDDGDEDENEPGDQRLCNIVPNPERFPRAARNWMNSHNDLRITRIIRCLRCCGLEAEAQSFYRALKTLYVNRIGYPRKISNRTFVYWTRAARRDLAIPPDMSDAEAVEKYGHLATN